MREIVAGKLATDAFFTSDAGAADRSHEDFTLAYTDVDGDIVQVTTDGDVFESVKFARKRQEDRVLLHLQGGRNWDVVEIASETVVITPKEEVPAIRQSKDSAANLAKKEESPLMTKAARTGVAPTSEANSMLLPIVAGVAAVCVVAGIILSRKK